MRPPLRIRTLPDTELVELARTGHRRAQKLLEARLCPRVARLATAIAGDADVGTRTAREAFTRVLGSESSPFAAAVVTEAQRLAVQRRTAGPRPLAGLDPEPRAAVIACDVEGMTTRVAAEQLGVDRREVVDWLERGRRALGAPPPPACAGWQLVARYDDLGSAERRAADAHLDLCEACRDARDGREAVRRDVRRALPAQAASLAGGVGAGAVFGGSVSGLAASAAATLAAGLVVVSGVLGPPGAPAVAVPDDRSGTPTAAVETEEVAVRDSVSGRTPAGSAAPPRAITDPPSVIEDGDGDGDGGGIVDDTVQDGKDTLDDTVDEVDDAVDETVDDAEETLGDTVEEVQDTVDDTVPETEETLDDTVQQVEDTADDTLQQVEDTADDTVQQVEDTADDTLHDAEDTLGDTVDEVGDTVDDTADAVDDTLETPGGTTAGIS